MKFKYAFSLTELMIAIAVIGILSAIAVPSYKDYAIRAKISEGFSILEAYKPKLQQFITESGRLPTQAEGNALLGTPITTNLPNNIAMIEYSAAWSGISAYFKTSIFPVTQARRELKLKASIKNIDLIIWQCGTSNNPTYDIDFKYLPSTCQNAF